MIIIKDIKIPSSCYECRFAKNKKSNDYGSFCECSILEDYETINLLEHSKYPNCPLIEQEFCDDCISRQAVEDAMYDATRAMDLNYGQIMDYIDNLSSVTPIRLKGHWIPRNAYLLRYKCSECNYKSEKYNFCPNCGAKMEEVEE